MSLKNKLKKLPPAPGIYLFYNVKKELIYVGKATNLRGRVASYFKPLSIFPLVVGRSESRPIEQMFGEVADIKWKETDSVLEAIIWEANYIKKFQPEYNVEGKDDKSWNYIVITRDLYPRVETVRQREAEVLRVKQSKFVSRVSPAETVSCQLRDNKQRFLYEFGPYPGLNTKAAMGLLRRLFFISACQKTRNKKQGTKDNPCFYYQLGQCLGVCTGEITPTEYKRKVVRPLILFLRGGKKRLIVSLEREMKRAAKREDFEEAARVRNQIQSLRRIHDVALLNKSFITGEEFRIKNLEFRIDKIEGYDVSNLGATGKVGSMVVFVNSEPDKSQYRRFRIRTVEGQSDVDCLEEVVRRRLKHANIRITNDTNLRISNANFWPLPDLFLVDGGKPQVNRVKKVFDDFKINIPIVGIAKGPTRKKNEFIYIRITKNTTAKAGSRLTAVTKLRNEKISEWINQNKALLIRVRDEAHRFAITYQRNRRRIM